ncbi:MAG TPA: CDP-alcohol phosphatidyltransferase family protein [Candidatus Binataceae bacterium]|nr:CDP-alcohol phosphatidyltransferase family protein [Candidatus Binataceae bacterium]
MLDSILGANSEVKRVQSQVARACFGLGIGPNQATIAAIAIGIASGIAFGRSATIAAIAMLLVSAALDVIDGTIARECSAPSALGGIIDLCGDRVVETCVIIGIAWGNPQIYFPALMLLCSWYVNITVFLAVGAALERRGPKLIEYPPGILERTEAIIFFVVLGIVEAVTILRPLGPFLCYLMTALEIVTAMQRLMFGVGQLRASGESAPNG